MDTIKFSDNTTYTITNTSFYKTLIDLDYLFAGFIGPFAKKMKIVNYTNHLYFWNFASQYYFRGNEKIYQSLIEKNQDLKNNQLVKNWFFTIDEQNTPEKKLEYYGKVHPLHVSLYHCKPINFCDITEDEFVLVLKKNFFPKFGNKLEDVFTFDKILTFTKGKNSNQIIELLIKKKYDGIDKLFEEIKPKFNIKFLEKIYNDIKLDKIYYIVFKYLTPGQKTEYSSKLKLHPNFIKYISKEDYLSYFKNHEHDIKPWELVKLEIDYLPELIKNIDLHYLSPFYIDKLKKKISVAELSDALYPWDD